MKIVALRPPISPASAAGHSILSPDPHRVGHSWDATQPSIEACKRHRRSHTKDQLEPWRSVKPLPLTRWLRRTCWGAIDPPS